MREVTVYVNPVAVNHPVGGSSPSRGARDIRGLENIIL